MDHNGAQERPILSRLNPQRDVLQNNGGSRGLRKGYPSLSLTSGLPAFGYANGSIRSSAGRDTGPLDDALVPQASSTSAAIGSPTFYTGGFNRGATKRFNSILADHADATAAESAEQDRTHASYSTQARPRSPVQEYNASFRLPSVLQKGWWFQPAFRVRRKRSISAESTSYERASHVSSSSFIRQLSRRQALGILCLTVLLLYSIFWRRIDPKGSRDTATIHVSGLDRDHTAFFERKWWEPPVRPSTDSLRKRPAKRTSFVAPRHTLEELLQLPSRYPFAISGQDVNELSLPTVAAVLDFSSITSDNGLTNPHFLQYANSLLQTLSQQTVRPHSVALLFPSVEASRTAQLLFGHDQGWLSANVVAGSAALSTLKTIQADFLLLLSCPGDLSSSVSGSNMHMIEHLLYAAGTADYENKILSTSGVRIWASTAGKLHAKLVPAQASDAAAQQALTESERVQMPNSPLLLRRGWLDDIPLHSFNSGIEDTVLAGRALFGFTDQIAIMLYKHLRVESYALPINSVYSQAFDYDRFNTQSNDIRRLADYAGWLPYEGSTVNPTNEQLGNPAKVAVFLPETTRLVDESLETLICRFSSEQLYGHEVRVFIPTGSELVDTSLVACPEVEVESVIPEVFDSWKPDICLSTTNDVILPHLGCTKIVLDVHDLRHADWLASLSLESLSNWYTPRIELVVITNNRPHSLHRLLTSLSSAIYFNDTVNLSINLEQTADEKTSQLVYDASWPFGNLSLRRRIILGELMPAIVESWYPINNDSYGVLLEDDVELSPHFYAWIKFAILQFRYGPGSTRASSRSMAGISLYQPKNIELRMEGRRKFDAHRIFADIGISATTPYLSQIPCSWGAVYFPEHWREFHQYLILRLGEVALDLSEPIVPEIRSNRWHKSWKRYMIELMYLRGYSMLYPNYEGFRSLSTNHLELGTHVKDLLAAQKRKASFEVPLLQLEDTVLEGLLDDHLPSWDGLPLLDFWGALATHGEVLERATITLEELALCPTPVAAQAADEDLEDLPEVVYRYDASEILCPRTIPTIQKGQHTLASAARPTTAEEREAALAEREAAVLERETRLAELEELGFDFSGEEVLVDA